jgi:hypothetical protein
MMASSSSPQPMEALVFMSLGVDHSVILDAVQHNKEALLRDATVIYLTETYGNIRL